jgi:NTE family protein
MKIALALGGGAIRGIAHLGVLRLLEKEGFEIGAIAGTSAGALIGALVASGCTADEILALFESIDQNRMFGRRSHDEPSLMGMSGIIQVLQAKIGDVDFDNLPIPFACTAVDIKTCQEVVLHNGCVLEAILASASMPGVFPAQHVGGYQLIDGGVLDPVPVEAARWLAPDLPIVAVVLSPVPAQWAKMDTNVIPRSRGVPAIIADQVSRLRLAQAFQIFVESVDISSRMLTELRLQVDQPDVILRPDVSAYPLLGDVNPPELAALGEIEATRHLDDLRRVTHWSYKFFRKIHKPVNPGELIPVKV